MKRSNLSQNSTTRRLIDLIGTPFNNSGPDYDKYSDNELLALYDIAFKNRVALLYLSLYRRKGWAEELEKKYQTLKQREDLTYQVIARIGDLLNAKYQNDYVIFKSIKPYPATPNDTDIIFLGDKAKYKEANAYLLENGYIFHEWAPQQLTYYDPRGVGKVGRGKKGGIYYIDFYQEVSTDYFAYLNKQQLRPHIRKSTVKGTQVNLLRPEPELAIIMFHNVFPERTFQLEHFYVPLYYLANKEFSIKDFLDFAYANRLDTAIRANFSILSYLHKEAFGFIPEPIKEINDCIGIDASEVSRFRKNHFCTPYMFSPRLFFKTFAKKCTEMYSLASLLKQAFKMLNPKFAVDVFSSLRNRLSAEGVYHLE